MKLGETDTFCNWTIVIRKVKQESQKFSGVQLQQYPARLKHFSTTSTFPRDFNIPARLQHSGATLTFQHEFNIPARLLIFRNVFLWSVKIKVEVLPAKNWGGEN